MFDPAFKRFIDESRDSGRFAAELSHTGAEARDAILNLIAVTDQIEKLIGERTDTGSDLRILQKRHEALKHENRALQKQIEGVHDAVSSQFGPLIKAIAAEIHHITDSECANRLKASVKHMVEILTKL